MPCFLLPPCLKKQVFVYDSTPKKFSEPHGTEKDLSAKPVGSLHFEYQVQVLNRF